MNIEVNYIAIVIAAVAAMAIGFLWYSPMILGKQWMQLKGLTENSLKSCSLAKLNRYFESFPENPKIDWFESPTAMDVKPKDFNSRNNSCCSSPES